MVNESSNIDGREVNIDNFPKDIRNFALKMKHSPTYRLSMEEVRNIYMRGDFMIDSKTKEVKFIKNNNTAVINVRRGDYLTQPLNHPVISKEYIYEAIKYLPNYEKCIILSDDIKWCKDNLPGRLFNPLYFIEDLNKSKFTLFNNNSYEEYIQLLKNYNKKIGFFLSFIQNYKWPHELFNFTDNFKNSVKFIFFLNNNV